MKKFLLVGAIALAPFAAFAGSPHGTTMAGNLAAAGSLSTAGVSSTQGTAAASVVKGDGVVVNGAVAGNYTAVQTTGKAKAGPAGAETKTTAQQVNIGGAVTGGYANTGNGRGNVASGMSSASQHSAATGNSIAAGADLSGYFKVDQGRRSIPTVE